MRMKRYKNNVPFGNTTMALLRVLPVLLQGDKETAETLAAFDELDYFERRLRWPLLLAWLPGRYREVCAKQETKNKRAKEKRAEEAKRRMMRGFQMPDQPAAPLKVGRKAKGKRDSCDCCKKAAKAGRFIKVNGSSVVCMSCLLK